MRVVIQRVSEASVIADGTLTGEIGKGLLVLAGFEEADTEEDMIWTSSKIAGMRIFSDAEGKMNLSVQEAGGGLLVVSQFTLHAQTKKGNRPSFIRAARPEQAIPLYDAFCSELQRCSGIAVQRGIFGADMKVSLINDGPVTIVMDSRNRE